VKGLGYGLGFRGWVRVLGHRWQTRRGKRTSFLASSSRSCNPALNPKARNLKPNLFLVTQQLLIILESLLALSLSLTRHPKLRPHHPEPGVVGHHLRHDRHQGPLPLLRTLIVIWSTGSDDMGLIQSTKASHVLIDWLRLDIENYCAIGSYWE